MFELSPWSIWSQKENDLFPFKHLIMCCLRFQKVKGLSNVSVVKQKFSPSYFDRFTNSLTSAPKSMSKTTKFMYRRLNLDSYLLPYSKLKSKWIKDLSIKTETGWGYSSAAQCLSGKCKVLSSIHSTPPHQKKTCLLEDKIGKTLEDIGIGKDFLNRTSRAPKILEVNKWAFIKFNSFSIAKETIKCEETIHSMGKKFPSILRGLISRTVKGLKKK